jgi:hypothetical protein
MEQLRSATTEMRMPKRMWVIGHLPIVRQFQVLGALLVTFLVLAALMLFLDGRQNTQGSAAESTATEMQMLYKRLARVTPLELKIQTATFPSLKNRRDREKASKFLLLSQLPFSCDLSQSDRSVEKLLACR